jgi:hypothetical protein
MSDDEAFVRARWPSAQAMKHAFNPWWDIRTDETLCLGQGRSEAEAWESARAAVKLQEGTG